MDFGGSDVTRCLHWLLMRSGFPYKTCELADKMDGLFLQELKETYCHLDQVYISSVVQFASMNDSTSVVCFL